MSRQPVQSSYRRLATDIIIIGGANALSMLGGFILVPLMTKTLGPVDYGLWAQAQITISLVTNLACLGLPTSIVRFIPAKTDRDEIQQDFYSALCLTFVVATLLTLGIILAAGPIAATFFDGSTRIVQITGITALLAVPATAHFSLMRALRLMKQMAVLMIAGSFAQVGLIAYLASQYYSLTAILVAVLGLNALSFVIVTVLVGNRIGISLPRFHRTREYLGFGVPAIAAGMSSWIVSSSDRYVIAYFLEAKWVGIYSAAYGLGTVLFAVATILLFVLPPLLSKAYDEGRTEEVQAQLSYTLKYLLALGIPFVLGAAVLSEELLAAFSTPAISSEGHRVVPLVAAACFFWSITIVPGLILNLTKKTRITALIWVAAALVNLGANMVIVPHLEILGAAITTAVAYFLAFVAMSYFARKELSVAIDWTFVAKSLAASATMSLAVWFMSPEQTWTAAATVAAGAAIYAAVILLLKGFSRDELAFFRRLIPIGRVTQK